MTRLHAEQFRVLIPAGVKDISVLQIILTGSATHPASCAMCQMVLVCG